MTALPWSVRIYLVVTVLVATAVPACLLVRNGIGAGGQIQVAAILSASMFLVWLFPLPVGFKTHYYLDAAIITGAALLLDPAAAMLTVGVGTLVAQVFRRHFLDESAFNTAQTMLQTGLASLIVALAGYQPGDVRAGSLGYVLMVIGIGIAIYIASAFLVGTIVGLQNGQNPLRVSFDSMLETDGFINLEHGAQIGLGLLIAVLGVVQAWTIVLLAPAVAVVYIALDRALLAHRQAARALRLQERNLSEAQRLAGIGSWDWDITTGVQSWSDEAFRILGYPEPLATPGIVHLTQRVHPHDRDLVDRAIHRAIRERGAFDIEHRVLLAGGEERTLHHRGEVVTDDGLHMVAMMHDITEQKSMKLKLEQLAFYDPLTGLLNRARLAEEIDRSLDNWQRGEQSFALLFVDLDGFKQVNDTLGHSAGDGILTNVGQRLIETVRDEDLVARYGGDEFLILARSVTRSGQVDGLASRLVQSLSGTTIVSSGTALKITASIGVVIPESRTVSSDELLHHVDAALYRAKRAGKNRYTIYQRGANGQSYRAAAR